MSKSTLAFTDIPAYTNTSLADIQLAHDKATATFRSGKTKDVEFRRRQLQQLYWAFVDYAEVMEEALMRDYRCPRLESHISTSNFIQEEVLFLLKNLDRFTADEKLENVPWKAYPFRFRIRKDPLGTALIIAPSNYPFLLALAPLMGAIAAGCTAVVKPSELVPWSAMVLTHLIQHRLDKDAYHVVNGAAEESTALLELKWDKIAFTGSNHVGRIIAKKAAENLTPVTLELSGRNPLFITKNTQNIELAARRALWGKVLNSGQICVSQNYSLVDRSRVDEFVAALRKAHDEFYPDGPKKSPDLARLINKGHFKRVQSYLQETKGRVVLGGDLDEDELYISPTVVVVDSLEDPLIVNETFCSVWSIVPVDDVDSAIEIANRVDPTPLTVLTMGNDAENDKILRNVASGGATTFDSYLHGVLPTIQFGGVGTSGTGSLRGRASIESFVHRRVIASSPNWLDFLLASRYPPYTAEKGRRMKMGATKPDFDRNGRKVYGGPLGISCYIFSLLIGIGGGQGTGRKLGAAVLWALVAAGAYAVRNPSIMRS